MKKINILEFTPANEFVELIKPAKEYIPSWYKKSKSFVGGKQIINNTTELGGKTFKLCIPFFDAMTSGYIIELAQDLQIIKDENKVLFSWGAQEHVLMEVRDINSLQEFPIPEEYCTIAFAWKFDYYIKTPKNYSILITHPFNALDLPFTTNTAIVDSDGILRRGNLPFLLKQNFEGIIPKGTPIAQIIPFKREKWKIKENKELQKNDNKRFFLTRAIAHGWYKKNQWSRKDYS